jgi:predicted DNA-binding protein (MmcQ/YjbR family)
MELHRAVEYILSKKGAEKTYPFDHETMVFKVGGKMFALASVHEPGRASLNLKSIPEVSSGLRKDHEEIIPGYHMNKRHWNTVYLDGKLLDTLIFELIDISYELVFDKLTRLQREDVVKGK